MESVRNIRPIFTAAAVVVATALLVWFGEGLMPWWPLAWLAPLPLFWYSLRTRWCSSALVSFLAFTLGSTNFVVYFLSQGTPISVWAADFGGISLMVAAGVLLFRHLVIRGAVWSGMLALPALWVTLDWARFWYTPHGTSADLAYTQLEFLPFLQLASVTGPWAMSFLLLLVPGGAVAILYLRRRNRSQALKIAAVLSVVVLSVLSYGEARLMARRPAQTLRVGLMASDSEQNEATAHSGAAAERLFGAYAAEARKLALAGAQVLLMPEKIATVSDDAKTDDEILQPLADDTGAVIVAGEVRLLTDNAGTRRYNRAALYTPHSPAASYDKEHLLPPSESKITPGKDTLTVLHQGANLGVAICKDMDFTDISRAYGALGTQAVLVPAWDFARDRVWHGHMAIMRGVEAGYSVVRAAKSGLLTVSDDRGRIVAETRSDSLPFATLLVDVPIGYQSTLFQKWGNWFAWVATGLLAVVVARAVSLTHCKT
jgi:apolipoprotein N-acyltransferase